LREFGQRFAVYGFVGDVSIDAFNRNVEQFRIVDFPSPFSGHSQKYFAGTRHADDIAFVQYSFGGGVLDGAVATNTLNEDARVWHQGLGFVGAQASYFAAGLHAEAAGLPTVPSRASAAEFFLATKLFLVVFAGGYEVYADQRGAD